MKRITRRGLLSLAMISLVSAGTLVNFGGGSAQAGEIMEVHGSDTVARTVLMPNKDALDKATGRSIHVLASGSSKGIISLINGKAEVAMISAPLDDVRASVERKAPGTIGKAELNQHRIGSVKTHFIVHPDNPVRSVSDPKLRDILLGRIVNWNELGGPDMPIVVFTTKPGKGLRSLVEKKFLNGQSITDEARQLGGLSQVVKVIAQAEYGIGFVNAPRLNSTVAVLPGVVVEQPLILVTKGAPSVDAQALITAMAKRSPS